MEDLLKVDEGPKQRKATPQNAMKMTLSKVLTTMDVSEMVTAFEGADFGWTKFEGPQSAIIVNKKLVGIVLLEDLTDLFSALKIRGNKLFKMETEPQMGLKIQRWKSTSVFSLMIDTRIPDRSKIRANTIQMAFPTMMCAISASVHNKGIELFDPKGVKLPNMFRWVGSLCFYAPFIVVKNVDGKGKKFLLGKDFANFIINYLDWTDKYISMRQRKPNEQTDFKRYNKLVTLSWIGRNLETYSAKTQMGWIAKTESAVEPGQFSDLLKKKISEHVGFDLWAQLKTLKLEAPKDKPSLQFTAEKLLEAEAFIKPQVMWGDLDAVEVF
jgi:hypothetical protein